MRGRGPGGTPLGLSLSDGLGIAARWWPKNGAPPMVNAALSSAAMKRPRKKRTLVPLVAGPLKGGPEPPGAVRTPEVNRSSRSAGIRQGEATWPSRDDAYRIVSLRCLTLELTGPERQGSLARPAQDKPTALAGPSWPAVEGPVERRVMRSPDEVEGRAVKDWL
jgi:hypothetical protein